VLYFDPGYVSFGAPRPHRRDRGSRRDLDSIVGLIDKLPVGDRDLEMRVLRAFARGDVEAQRRVLAELPHASDATLTLPVWDVAVFAGDIEGAETIARGLTDPTRSVDAQAAGHATLAYLALAQGKVATARAELARAAQKDSVRALEYGTLLEVTPFLATSRPVLEQARRALEHLSVADVPPSAHAAVYFSAHDGFHHLLRLYLLGLVNAHLGDFAAAERYAGALARETGPPAAATLPRDLALEIRAEATIGQGAPGLALSQLRQTAGETWYEYHFSSPFLAGSRERYRRAELEAAHGDARQALALFSWFEGFSGYALIYAAPSHLRRAQLFERLGDTPAAVTHYERFLKLWKDCDPEFRPLVDSARVAYERVSSAR
jgi:tetratricopeptide (TPR) repeat protein